MIVSVEELLQQNLKGTTIIFPTDTVYGVGCLLSDIDQVHRIYELKNRDYSKPMAILCANMDQVRELVKELGNALNIANTYWPGALTLIFDKSSKVSDVITSNQPTVGIRIPNSPIALPILEHFGPMVVTSLNLSNEPAILSFQDALTYESKVDYIVKGPDLSNQASTVYDPINDVVLRQEDLVIDRSKLLKRQ